MYDEHLKSTNSDVCHMLWSILLWPVRVCSLTIESGRPIRAKYTGSTAQVGPSLRKRTLYVGLKLTSTSLFFFVFLKVFRVFGVQEEKKEVEGKGEGGKIALFT